MAISPGKAVSKGSGEAPAHKVGANHGANEVFLLCCIAHICHRPFPAAKYSITGDIIFVKGEMCKVGIVNELESILQVAHSIERYINDVLLLLVWK